MKSIFTILQDIEKLIYKILMWVLLLPKTIYKITTDPGWAPDYVTKELNPTEKDAPFFDEYMSPVILLLVVALIPALAFSFLPTFGVTISSPAEQNSTTDRFLSFNSQANFKSASTAMEYEHTWTVEKINEDGSYPVIYFEDHFPGSEDDYFKPVDNNTVEDGFLFNFTEPGSYYVNVYSAKYIPPLEDPRVLEMYASFLTVTVPVKLEEPILISNDNAKAATAANQNQSFDTFSSQVQKEKTIFLALALMLPPLLFAFATSVRRGDDISEDALKESFYVQCYYFSPPSLAIWATYYAIYFYTSDVYFFSAPYFARQILLLPPLLAALWFFRTEVKTVTLVRGIKTWQAAIVVALCIAVLAVAAKIVFSFADFQDGLRLGAIWFYPVTSAALIAAFGLAWYGRRKAEGKRVTPANIALFTVYAAAFIGLSNLAASYISLGDVQLSEVVQETQVSDAPAPTPTPTPAIQATGMPTEIQPTAAVVAPETATPEPPRFYTEEFNGDLTTWIEFMTSGDTRMVEWKQERGVLSVQLFKREDRLPKFYLINDSFTYGDAKIEAVVSNRGNNANGVGLICRYSDIGWYEIQVSNSQAYALYAVDNVGIVNQGYNELAKGESRGIKSGLSTNVYTAICKGNTISLFVNDAPILEFTDTKYGLEEGKIGLSVWSPKKLPVNVDFETITVSEPE